MLPPLLPTLLVARVVVVVAVCRNVRDSRAFLPSGRLCLLSCMAGLEAISKQVSACVLLNVDGIDAKNGVFAWSSPIYLIN